MIERIHNQRSYQINEEKDEETEDEFITPTQLTLKGKMEV